METPDLFDEIEAALSMPGTDYNPGALFSARMMTSLALLQIKAWLSGLSLVAAIVGTGTATGAVLFAIYYIAGILGLRVAGALIFAIVVSCRLVLAPHSLPLYTDDYLGQQHKSPRTAK